MMPAASVPTSIAIRKNNQPDDRNTVFKDRPVGWAAPRRLFFNQRCRLLLLLGALLSLAACARGQQLPATPVRETVIVPQTVMVERVVEVTPTPDPSQQQVTLRLNLGEEPYSLDPALAALDADLWPVNNLFAGLTALDEQGTVQPALAESWQASEDGLRWRFTLRADAQWATYQPSRGATPLRAVTADDAVFALRRACDPRRASPQAALNDVIVGCRDARLADAAALNPAETDALLAAVQVVALDPRTVQINLAEPAGYLPVLLSLPFNYPLPQEVLAAHGERWTEAGHLAASGPFVLGGWFHGDSLTLLRNPFWYGWQQGGGNLDRVDFVMLDAEAALASFRRGELDSLTLTADQAAAAQADPALALRLSHTPAGCTEYLALNSNKAPLDAPLVRRALAAALDRQTLAELHGPAGMAAHTFAPAGVFGSAAADSTLALWAADETADGWSRTQAQQQAQAWLAEAGYAAGAGFPVITLLHNAAAGSAATAEAIAAQWRAVLGIAVQVQSLAWPEFSAVLSAETPAQDLPHVWRTAFCGDYADQHGWIGSLFNTGGGADALRWAALAAAPLAADGSSFNQLTTAAAQAADPAARQALYQAAERILLEDAAVVIPLIWYTESRLVQANVQPDAPYQLAAWRK